MKKQGFKTKTRFVIFVTEFLNGAINATNAMTPNSVGVINLTKKNRTIFYLTVTFLLVGLGSLSAKEPNGIKYASGPLNKGVGIPISTLSNVNNWSMWIRADGWSGRNPSTGGSGGIFPRGITIGVIFADGLVWTGLVQDGQSPVLRAGGGTYAIGTVPGRIISKGVAENPDAADVRIWRALRGYPTADLRQDAADLLDLPLSNVTSAEEDAVRDQYRTDWEEWPAEKGAPFYDSDGDGIYTPQFEGDNFTPLLYPDADEPGIANADQVVWFVANDLTDGAVRALYGSPSIGLEMQVTLWAYDSDGPLGNTIFKQYRLIYKGTAATSAGATIDSMYIAQWSDPDLGSFGDDYVGVDTLLSLGYVYNSTAVDNGFEAFNLPPPAAGYVLLQGPIVESVGDTAIFDFRRLPGYKNLSMSSFGYFAAGTDLTDPFIGTYDGTLQWRNVHQGLRPDGQPHIDPTTSNPELFTLYGDPVRGTGWLDSGPADRRMVMNTGPFDMALGDTQDVVLALVAGMGTDNISSVIELRNNVRLPHALQANLFTPAPQVNASVNYISTTQSDVVITIDSPEAVTAAEALIYDYPETFITSVTLFDDGAHNDGDAGDGVWGNTWTTTPRASGVYMNIKITTADGTQSWSHMANRVTTVGPVIVSELLIEDDSINEDGIINNGEKIIYSLLIQNGSSSNVQDLLVFVRTTDSLITEVGSTRGNALANIPANSTALLESDLDRFFVISELAHGGALISIPVDIFDRMYNRWSSELQISVTQLPFNIEIGSAEHVEGRANGLVGYRVADESALTGDEYEITFNEIGADISFNLANLTTSTNLLEGNSMPVDIHSNDIPITEGFKVVLVGPPPGVEGWDVPNGTRRFTWANADFGFEGFNGAIGWASPNSVFGGGPPGVPGGELVDVLLKLAPSTDNGDLEPPTFDMNHVNVSYGYRYGRNFSAPAQQPQFEPFIINTTGAGYDYQDFTKSVPLSAWDVDADPPRRLALGFLENNQPVDPDAGGGMVDGVWWPPASPGGNNVAGAGPREWLWIFNTEYSETPDPAYQVEAISDPFPIMYWLTVARRGFGVSFEEGDEFLIIASRPFSTADVYRFNSVPTFVEDETGIPKSYELSQNYPNPFNPVTTIKYKLPFMSDVKLLIYNILGQEVFRLEQFAQQAGEHLVRWNGKNMKGSELSSGIYFYRLHAGDFVQTRKMVLLK